MPVLRYWDIASSSYLPLTTGPTGPVGPAGPQGFTTGQVLAMTYYQPGTVVNVTTAAAMAAIDTTNLTLSFTAVSASTIVTLEGYGGIYGTTGSASMSWGLWTHGTSNFPAGIAYLTMMGNGSSGVPLGTSIQARLTGSFRMTTVANTAYQVDWTWSGSGGTWFMSYGGATGPAIMRAIAN